MKSTKTCPRCGIEKSRARDYYTRTGRPSVVRAWCKECEIADSTLWAKKNAKRVSIVARKRYQSSPERREKQRKYCLKIAGPEQRAQNLRATDAYKKRNPEKHRAHGFVKRALKSGKLVRQPCEVCGSSKKIRAHHNDYSQPLEVMWLCNDHHIERHLKLTG